MARADDRALVEAGYMPLSVYIKKYAPAMLNEDPWGDVIRMVDSPLVPQPTCHAIQYGDSTVCNVCMLAWDTNDDHPPACQDLGGMVDNPSWWQRFREWMWG